MPKTSADPFSRAVSMYELDFGRSGGLAKRVGDAVAERGAEFSHLCLSRRQEQTLLTPELPPDSAEDVGEGRPPLLAETLGTSQRRNVAAGHPLAVVGSGS